MVLNPFMVLTMEMPVKALSTAVIWQVKYLANIVLINPINIITTEKITL